MKKLFLSFIVVLIFIIPMNLTCQANQVVIFKDFQLEKALRNKINKPNGTIYSDELSIIKEIDLSNLHISNLSGIEHLIYCEELNLSHNQIIDIKPLREVKRLKILNLSHNQIRDITPLQSLIFLEQLFLENNQILFIPDLSQLRVLEHFSINHD